MGIKEEEVQAIGRCNIFDQIITENFPNLKEVLPIQLPEPPGYQTGLTKLEPPHGILSLKQQAQKQRNNT
jgi:hypothetical protein